MIICEIQQLALAVVAFRMSKMAVRDLGRGYCIAQLVHCTEYEIWNTAGVFTVRLLKPSSTPRGKITAAPEIPGRLQGGGGMGGCAG